LLQADSREELTKTLATQKRVCKAKFSLAKTGNGKTIKRLCAIDHALSREKSMFSSFAV
jgi:hypothetical protein